MFDSNASIRRHVVVKPAPSRETTVLGVIHAGERDTIESCVGDDEYAQHGRTVAHERRSSTGNNPSNHGTEQQTQERKHRQKIADVLGAQCSDWYEEEDEPQNQQ